MGKKYNRYIKKGLIYCSLFIMLLLFLSPVVKAVDYDDICGDENIMSAIRIISVVIKMCVWIVPILIIVLGMVDFGKAVVASDEKAISTATQSLIRRFIAGVIIFFIPSIILGVLNVTGISEGIEKEGNTFGACTICILDLDKCDGASGNRGGAGGGGGSYMYTKYD